MHRIGLYPGTFDPPTAGHSDIFGRAAKLVDTLIMRGIEILQTIYFRTNRDVIESRSFSLLDNVARLLVEHPEMQHVRVEGHTDTRGRLANNMRLSQQRAESVMRYLVEHGVDASRLEAQGYGPTRLIVENARNREEHARNRRVVFTIVGANGDIQSQNDGPGADTID